MKGLALAVFVAFALPGAAESPALAEANVLRHAGDLAGARRVLKDAVAAGDASAELRAELGAVLLELDDPGAAEGYLAGALAEEPRADTAFNLAIARYRLKKWDEAWKVCLLCLKWSERGTRLQERAAEIGVAIAARLEEREAREAAWSEIAKWAGETEGGREAAGALK